MNFYPYRTIDEQADRLPLEFQEKYKTTALDRIEIDGCEIHGYFEYSFMEEKSYFVQPERSQDGSITGLNNYSTFLTPRLIIKYNMMNIEDYRTLMTFLKSKNTFNVTCYDIVADRRVTHEMYFANPSMPIIYQQYLLAMGVMEYGIELIGTNNKSETVKFFIDGTSFSSQKNESWLSFTLRGETNYKVLYSSITKGFIVTQNPSYAVYEGEKLVSPHDIILENYDYSVRLL